MTIEFNCLNCQKTLRVDDKYEGKKARCPSCQTINTVTARQPAASSQQVDPFSDQATQSYDNPYPQDPFAGSAPHSQNPYASGLPPKTSYSAPARSGRRGRQHPHRGGVVLTLGIMSFLCNILFIPSILALTFGLTDLGKMKRGTMDPSGYGMTLAGTILGGIVLTLAVLFGLLFLVAAIAGAGAR